MIPDFIFMKIYLIIDINSSDKNFTKVLVIPRCSVILLLIIYVSYILIIITYFNFSL